MITSFLIGNVCSQLADKGLANVLAVETLKHGTSPLAYMKIRCKGGLPKTPDFIGSGHGVWDTSGYFHLFKENIGFLDSLIKPRLHVELASQKYLAFSLMKRFGERKNYNPFVNFFILLSSFSYGFLSNFVVPTLNFRFCKQEITAERFQNDPDYGFAAYRTTQKVEAWRIGFFGTFLTGANFELWSRIKENPQRFLVGVIQLTGAAFLGWYHYPLLSKVGFIAGALLA